MNGRTTGEPGRADVAELRVSYGRAPLLEADLAPDWHTQFTRWFDDAVASLTFPEPNAMVVATCTADGIPSARTVLLKAHDENGLVFFTNYSSRKGLELAANPRVSCVFGWYAMERQVVVCGRTERVDRTTSERYFHSRPHGSQIAASISEQSTVIPDRGWLDRRRDELARQYPDDTQVPLPDFWGGIRVLPDTVEFWAGRENRMHDRLRYRRTGAGFVLERLSP